MKVLINTIGKKIHTLVKENTPYCHKNGRNVVSLKRLHFSTYHCVIFPTVVQIYIYLYICIGKEVRLILPNTYQEIYDTHTCLNFLKTCEMCVYMIRSN